MSFMIDDVIVGFDDIGGHLFDFGYDIFLKLIIFIGIGIVQISLKLVIGYFISRLIFLIILRVFLNSIVC